MEPTSDVDAFDALYVAEWGRIVAALVLMGSDRRTAEEITQETFIRAWARWDRVVVLDRAAPRDRVDAHDPRTGATTMTHDELLDDHRPDPDLSWLLVPVAPPAGGAAAARAGGGRVLTATGPETPGTRPDDRRRGPVGPDAPAVRRPAPPSGWRSAALDPLVLEGLPDYVAPGPGSTGELDSAPEPPGSSAEPKRPGSSAEDDALPASAVPPGPISLRAPRDRGFWLATAALVAALAGFGWAGHLALGLRTTEHRVGALAAEVMVLQEDEHDRAVARLSAQMQNGWIVADPVTLTPPAGRRGRSGGRGSPSRSRCARSRCRRRPWRRRR